MLLELGVAVPDDAEQLQDGLANVEIAANKSLCRRQRQYAVKISPSLSSSLRDEIFNHHSSHQ